MKPFALVFAILVSGIGHAQKEAPCKCPVTLLTIPSKKAAAAKSVYKGKTYYFCTTNCKELFDKNPKKYIAHLKG